MVRKLNKGVSMVEVLIALTIFMILMVPLVSALITGMDTTTSAKETQYRNEYVQNLMETVKEVPVSELKSGNTSFFTQMGSKDVVISSDTITDTSGALPFTYDVHTITGKTYLGTDRTEYAYRIQISGYDYAKEAAENAYKDPNSISYGIVENLDQTEVALISAPFANYDQPAYDALLTKKVPLLKAEHEANNQTFDVAKDIVAFAGDKGKREIRISVSKSATGYDVTCTLKYSDTYLINKSVTETVDYVPYERHFDELPNIYLIYNVGIYNNQYTDDYITFDLSGMNETKDVNVFVIPSAEKYSQNLKDVDALDLNETLLESTSAHLFREIAGVPRTSANIGFGGASDVYLSNLKLYHGFKSTSFDPSGAFEVKSTGVMNSLFGSSYNDVNGNSNLKDVKEDRGLYKINIWMQKEAVDTSVDPVLKGTRGGGEID